MAFFEVSLVLYTYYGHHQLTDSLTTSMIATSNLISVSANQIADHNHVRHDIDPCWAIHKTRGQIFGPPPLRVHFSKTK